MEILLIGGGVGGLTLALCLHRAGVRSRIFEATREYRPLGVGINLLPHAVCEPSNVGVAADRLRYGELVHLAGAATQ